MASGKALRNGCHCRPINGCQSPELSAAATGQWPGDHSAREKGRTGTSAKRPASESAKLGKAYRAQFPSAPGSGSPYTYDSVNLLLAAAEKAGGFARASLEAALTSIAFSGWTGPVDIEPRTGNRVPATVVMTEVDPKRGFRIDPQWARAVRARF